MKIPALAALMMVLAGSALAADAIQCGQPEPARLETDPGRDFCDIYARRVDYAREQREFRELLMERQKNYYAPQQEAREAYENHMDSRWEVPDAGND